ncbi:hypothetical protein [Georgenia muralis]
MTALVYNDTLTELPVHHSAGRNSFLALSVGGIGVAVAAPAAAGPVQATLVQPGAPASEDLYWSTAPEAGQPSHAMPEFSINATWAACGVSDASTKLVRTFTRVAWQSVPAGKAYLKCGSDAWGYRHIQKNHQAHWEAIAVYDGVNWRTAADWAIAETLLYPASATYVSSNDTYYYKRQIQLRDKSTGKVVAVKYVTSSSPERHRTSSPPTRRVPERSKWRKHRSTRS